MPETAPPAGSLAEALATIPDPRRAHLRVHDLVPLLQFAVAALLCGCRSLYAMAQWGQERREDDPDLLIELGLRPGRSPSVATLHRVFKRLDVAAFERALGDWLARSGIAPAEPLAVDGKTLRGVHGEGIPGAHLVSVYAPRARAVLAQIRTAAKGGELAATKEALAQVDLQGRVVMGDALQTQREVCTQIVAGGGDYLLPFRHAEGSFLNQPNVDVALDLQIDRLLQAGPFHYSDRADRTSAAACRGRALQVRRAAAMLVAPTRRRRAIPRLRSPAHTWGAAPLRTWLRSSSKVTSRTQCNPFSIPQYSRLSRRKRRAPPFRRPTLVIP